MARHRPLIRVEFGPTPPDPRRAGCSALRDATLQNHHEAIAAESTDTATSCGKTSSARPARGAALAQGRPVRLSPTPSPHPASEHQPAHAARRAGHRPRSQHATMAPGARTGASPTPRSAVRTPRARPRPHTFGPGRGGSRRRHRAPPTPRQGPPARRRLDHHNRPRVRPRVPQCAPWRGHYLARMTSRDLARRERSTVQVQQVGV